GAQHRLLASAQDGVGKLVSKQVEASNVDLSQEFGDLILIQRGFQASSQVVSVSNDMIQQLFGIRGQG
ncbi:MAG TPA: flagellar basal body rod C-terminal domain-containing protein, partial [Caulobacteraceae bacterium]|nr:flagellar basal body rod C-terminal domain-containing protein [Caulobacteraceae bacterium]